MLNPRRRQAAGGSSRPAQRRRFMDDMAAGPDSDDGAAEGGANVRSDPRALSYPFTLNNYTEEEFGLLRAMEDKAYRASYAVRYICFGKEIAPETGTPHLQGYIRFEAKRGKSMRATHRIPGMERSALIGNQRGTDDENREYCLKGGEDGVPKEKGICISVQVKIYNEVIRCRLF